MSMVSKKLRFSLWPVEERPCMHTVNIWSSSRAPVDGAIALLHCVACWLVCPGVQCSAVQRCIMRMHAVHHLSADPADPKVNIFGGISLKFRYFFSFSLYPGKEISVYFVSKFKNSKNVKKI